MALKLVVNNTDEQWGYTEEDDEFLPTVDEDWLDEGGFTQIIGPLGPEGRKYA